MVAPASTTESMRPLMAKAIEMRVRSPTGLMERLSSVTVVMSGLELVPHAANGHDEARVGGIGLDLGP